MANIGMQGMKYALLEIANDGTESYKPAKSFDAQTLP